MDARPAQISTICECIDHCFAFAMWCDEFAKHVDPDDMTAGLDRAFDLVSDATRLQSFLALRKLDDFLGGVKPMPNDLIAANLGINVPSVLGDVGDKFLPVTGLKGIDGPNHLKKSRVVSPSKNFAELHQVVCAFSCACSWYSLESH